MFEEFQRHRARRKLGGAEADPGDRRPDTTQPAGTDCLPQIDHIIVLMMENHSYDNYFGMLERRGDGFTLGPDGIPIGSNPSSDGSLVPLQHFESTKQVPSVPTQAWSASHIQWNSGQNDGFVESIERTLPGKDATVSMRYWDEQDLPFYYGLARTFPLATRWFSSCLGPTFPNRRFLVAATANGLIDDLPFNMADYPASGTVFDHLDAHGISWANYHHVKSWSINLKRLIRSGGVNALRIIGAIIGRLIPSLLKTVESKLQATADLYPLGTLRSISHLRNVRQFFEDCTSGTLPSVSIVDPDFGKWSEENPQDVSLGEAFSARVINAVMKGPGWPKTLLIWTYDEHGGYYDHVPPPPAPAPDQVPAQSPATRHWWLRLLLPLTPYAKRIQVIDDGPSTYEQLGFRVPAVVVSPYARPHFLSDVVHDHTSILKLIERKWNLPPLTARDAWASDPLEMVDLASAPSFLVPPPLPTSRRSIDLGP